MHSGHRPTLLEHLRGSASKTSRVVGFFGFTSRNAGGGLVVSTGEGQ